MKKLYAISLIGVLAFVLSACSNDDEPYFSGRIDSEYLENLMEIGATKSYTLSHIRTYWNRPNTNYQWEEYDYKEWDGWQSPFPSTLAIVGGQAYIHPTFFISAYGLHPVYMLWRTFLRTQPRSYVPEFYYSVPFDYDKAGNTLSINHQYNVVEASGNKLVLYYDSDFTSSDGKGVERVVAYYTECDPKLPAENERLFFDNLHELYGFMLGKAHDEFGDSVDLNQYYYPDIIFDHPMVDIAELIRNWENGLYDTDDRW